MNSMPNLKNDYFAFTSVFHRVLCSNIESGQQIYSLIVLKYSLYSSANDSLRSIWVFSNWASIITTIFSTVIISQKSRHYNVSKNRPVSNQSRIPKCPIRWISIQIRHSITSLDNLVSPGNFCRLAWFLHRQ